jgi:hypothetical protein
MARLRSISAAIGAFFSGRRNRLGISDDRIGRVLVNDGDVGKEAIAAARDRFDKARILHGIAERLADLAHGLVEPVVVVDHRPRPQTALKFLARHDFARPFQQRREQLEWLLLQTDPPAAPGQHAVPRIGFEDAKPRTSAKLRCLRHEAPLSRHRFLQRRRCRKPLISQRRLGDRDSRQMAGAVH